MGNVCAALDNQNSTVECPHKHKNRFKRKPNGIRSEINQDYACQFCKELKELKIKNQQAKLSDKYSQLSLTSHDVESEYNKTPKNVQSKYSKKTIDDFEVVRGLGKGGFGRVYMIREKESFYEDTVQEIMSLEIDESLSGQLQEIEQIAIQYKKQSTKQSLSQNTPEKQNNNTVNLINDDTPKQKKHPQKSQESGSKIFAGPKYYALKILNKKEITSQSQKLQAISQRHILQAMDHPFIVKLHYAFQTKSRLFLIVDLLAGGQLFYLLRKYRKFDQEMTRFYAAQILLALQYLHKRSIIYRDLKPENILLDSEGHIKITDFGLSKVLYSKNQKTYSLCGTPEYIAPQVIIGGGYNQAADWFSFGSLIYDMLTGRPPFLNNNKSTMLRNLVTTPVPLPYYLSDSAKSLLDGLFKIKPEQRLGSKNGAEQIKKHKFFKGIDFSALKDKKIKPPVNFIDHHLKNEQVFLNSNGFEKWSSWQLNMHSPEVKKTKQSKQHFEGFTYENVEFDLQQQTLGQQQNH